MLPEATQKNVLTSTATAADVEEELKMWLRGAPDRNGGRIERTKKAKQRKSGSAATTSTDRRNRGRSSSRDSSSSHSSHVRRSSATHRSGRSRSARQRDRSSTRSSGGTVITDAPGNTAPDVPTLTNVAVDNDYEN